MRLRHFLVFFLLIWPALMVSVVVNATNTARISLDSLLVIARSTEHPDSVRLLSYVSIVAGMQPNAEAGDSLQSILHEALLFANERDQLEKWIELISQKGIEDRRNYRYNQAIFWHNLQFQLADSLRLDEFKVSALNNLGLIYRRINNYQAAIDAYQQAIRLSESTENNRGYVYATNGLGNIYLELNNLSEAMVNFRACLRVEQSQNNLFGVAINLNNIGHVYMQSGEPEKALEYFMLSLEVNREIGSQRGIAICYNDMGDIYRLRGDNDKALNYYQMSLHLNEAIQDRYYLSINNLRLAEIFSEKNVNIEAIKYVKKAIELSIETSNRNNLAKAYELMYKLQRKLGNVNQAIEFLEKATSLNDSILNENTQRTIFLMQATFNRERADNEIAILQNEKEIASLQIKRQKIISNVIAVGLLVLIASMAFLYSMLRFKAKANRELKAKNDEIEQASKKLSDYAEKLLTAKQEAERSNQLKSQFLANVSHEIRTPMNSVIGFADLLSKMLTDPKQLGYLESIRSSGRSLLVLIDDILDLSRIEAGKLQLTPKPLDLSVLFDEIKQVFSLQASKQELLLTYQLDKNFPKFVLLNETGMRQVLLNLVGNAIKFTNNGVIRITATANQLENQKCNVTIQIEDTGQGIKVEDQMHIFEAFYQASGSRYATKGTGLGLTITKRLVETMNGSISMHSVYGQGTHFTINFPELVIMNVRTALRVVDANELTKLSSSGICLLSTDVQINHFVDIALRDQAFTCDIYENINNFSVNEQHYHIVIWELSMYMNFAKNISSTYQRSDLKNIIILKEGQKMPQTITSETISIETSNGTRALKELLITNQSSTDFNFPNLSDDKGISEILIDPDFMEIKELFSTVKQTQLIHEIRLFASKLEAYGNQTSNRYLEETGKRFDAAAEVIDIAQLSELMSQFDALIKRLDEKADMND